MGVKIQANDEIDRGTLTVENTYRGSHVEFERDGKKWAFFVTPGDAKELAIALLGGTP